MAKAQLRPSGKERERVKERERAHTTKSCPSDHVGVQFRNFGTVGRNEDEKGAKGALKEWPRCSGICRKVSGEE